MSEAKERGPLSALLSPQESQTKSEAEGAPLMRGLVRFGREGPSPHLLVNAEAASDGDPAGAAAEWLGSRLCPRALAPFLPGLDQRMCTLVPEHSQEPQ